MLVLIAHVISTPTGVGGAERVAAALAKCASQRRWEAVVLNPFADDPETSALKELCAHVPYDGHRARRWQDVPATRRWLHERLSSLSPDIVHLHLFHALALASTIPRPRRARVLLTHHHGSVFASQRRRLAGLTDRLAGHRTDRIVAPSEWVRQYLVKTYRYPASKVTCILNGWEGYPEARADRSAVPTAVCVANFRPEKGHDVLIDAFARVVPALGACRLVLVGSGPLRSALEAHVRALDLSNHVTFAGAVEDVWGYLEQARVFTLASRMEGLGIALLEAMAAGLPVVAPATGGIVELVEHGVTGELVPPGDSRALADSLLKLLSSRETSERMGLAGRLRAADHTMAKMVTQYFELYDSMVFGDRTTDSVGASLP